MDLSMIKGIGPKVIEHLNKLDIYDVNDLISHYPFRYEILERSNIDALNQDDKIIIDGVIESTPVVYRFKRNMNRMMFNINTGNKILKIYIFNRAFMKNNLNIGKVITVIGKYDMKKGIINASDIMFTELNDNPTIIPIYRTTNNLNRKALATLIQRSLEVSKGIIKGYIPEYLYVKYNLLDKYSSLLIAHNPDNIDLLKKSRAMLKYEELFMFMLKINYLKLKNDNIILGHKKDINIELVNDFISKLPFELTIDQKESINQIIDDLNSNKRMNRLLQGDVGSGKTIVALISCYAAITSGYQCAFMAPTEILAKQHYQNVLKLFNNLKVELLIGSMTKKQKDNIKEKLLNNEIDILIGTHSLIQEDIKFNNLGLVITDEQHRFGVNQRNNLRNKGEMPDVLYMSATPIPRTYALTIYGDMDISTIKTIHPGKKKIITYLKDKDEIKDVLLMIKKELDMKHQVYVVAPSIEEDSELENVKQLSKRYELAFKNYSIGILHGKMKEKEKDKIMQEFIDNKINILISTTVIEVGVDVKNATMMVIHNADMFGLSTLHQLRGRVGRNDLQSYCTLIGNKDSERLKIMESVSDGFEISEADFNMRGSGDLFGTRQSGDMQFKIADIKKDFKIMLMAKEDSMEFLNNKLLDNYKYIKEELRKSVNID